MNIGFTLTRKGRALLTSLLAGAKLELTRVMFGSGKLGDQSPVELTGLVAPMAQGTVTPPVIKNGLCTFVTEYRNDLDGGLEQGFYLNEYGVYALDPTEGEILVYYATLGDFPSYVMPYAQGAVDTHRFVVALGLNDNVGVTLGFPAGAFMTAEEIGEYVRVVVIPAFDERARELIAEHDGDPAAHRGLMAALGALSSRVTRLEDMLINDVSENSFMVTFGNLDGVKVTGVWNAAQERIEF